MDDPLVHKFSTNMFYGEMWQKCWVCICQFGQTGKTDQFKIIRTCYKKITYKKLKWDKQANKL